jgi:hypothetical protein
MTRSESCIDFGPMAGRRPNTVVIQGCRRIITRISWATRQGGGAPAALAGGGHPDLAHHLVEHQVQQLVLGRDVPVQ